MKKIKLISRIILISLLAAFSPLGSNAQNKDIFQAIEENDLVAIKSSIKDNPEVLSSSNENKYTPLHLASELGHVGIVKYLVKKGADIDSKNHLGDTPLHLAATGGDWANPPSENHLTIVKFLVSNGADLNKKNDADMIPAFKAIIFKKGIIVISYLLNNGTDLSNEDDAFNFLSRSCERGYPEIADLLLDKKIKLPVQQNRQVTLVYRAAYVDQLRLFNLLLEGNPDILQGREEYIVSSSAESGSINILKLLAAKGLSLNVTNRYGNSLIHTVSQKGHLDVLNLILDNGIDINSKNSINKTALQIAREYEKSEIEVYLIQNGANDEPYIFPDLTGPYLGQEPPGNTPVMFAPGIVSIEGNEHSPPTFSKDGNEAFWVQEFPMQIFGTTYENGQWNKPKKVAFNYGQGDGEPFLSYDDNTLYFLSSRSLEGPTNSDRERIWYVKRTENAWSEPTCLNEDGNLYPMHWTISTDQEGSIYFASQHSSGYGNNDIFKTSQVNGVFQKPENLGPVINTELSEGTPFMAPDQSYLICSIRSHPEGQGSDDLFISFNIPDKGWSTPQNLGEKINSRGNDLAPIVSPDGKYLFYLSSGDIYWVDTSFIEKLRPTD